MLHMRFPATARESTLEEAPLHSHPHLNLGASPQKTVPPVSLLSLDQLCLKSEIWSPVELLSRKPVVRSTSTDNGNAEVKPGF